MYMSIYRPFLLNSRHNIAGILLKVALNTIIRTHSLLREKFEDTIKEVTRNRESKDRQYNEKANQGSTKHHTEN
jgi:hypothetical protein